MSGEGLTQQIQCARVVTAQNTKNTQANLVGFNKSPNGSNPDTLGSLSALGKAATGKFLNQLGTDQIAIMTSTDTLSASYMGFKLPLDTTQVAAITTTNAGYLTPIQIRNMTTTNTAALSTTQLPKIAVNTMPGFTGDQVATLSTTQLVVITTSQLPYLQIDAFSALTTSQIASLTTNPNQIQAITSVQLAALNTNQIKALTNVQTGQLLALQTQGLNIEQVAALAL